ncbi:MAG: glycosyltransferase family 4 protein [Lachnospiraceae bacterium]
MKQIRKKVLIIVSTNIYGGAERVLADYLRDNQDFEFFLLTNRKASVKEAYEDVLPEDHIFTTRFVLCRWDLKKHPLMLVMFGFSYLFSNWLVLRLVRHYQIDVLYGNNSTDLPILTAIRRLKPDLRNVSHIHDMLEEDSMMGKYFMKHYRSLDHIIVPSEANAEYLSGLMESSVPITVAYNGIQVSGQNSVLSVREEREQKNNFRYRIAMVGTISDRKDPMAFLRILSELTIPYEAVIAGPVLEEPLYRQIGDFVHQKNLPVEFIGTLDQNRLKELYLSTDLLMLTSKRDSLPNVILEAMSVGTLVLAKSVGGVPEMIEDGVTGFLYTEADSDKKVALQAETILQMNQATKMIIRKNAQDKVRNMFTEEEKRRRVFQVVSGGGYSHERE